MQKKIYRKCQSCKQIFDREDLIKITKLNNGTLKINPTSKELGRSVYVCKNMTCIDNFIKKNRLKLSLKYSNFDEIKRIENELRTII